MFLFSEEYITENMINVHLKTRILYNWNISLDKFMINAEIKLFLMDLGYTMLNDLNEKEARVCFDYAGMEGYMVPVWKEIQKQYYND